MALTDSITDIQERLTSAYFHIGKYLNQLKNDIQDSLEESEKTAADFRSSIESDKKESLKKYILNMETAVKEAEEKYNIYSETLVSLFKQLNESFNVINSMNRPIEQIIDSAEMMELLALNSMVVAIQAGKQGGGFTYITEELQKNAKSTFSVTSEIDSQRNTVISNYNDFKKKTDSMINMLNESNQLLSRTLNRDFKNIYKCIEDSVLFFENINTEADKLKPMVLNIMEGIQNQDIVRQSLDHVVLSISEIENSEISSEISSDENVIIKNKLLELCIYVIDEVAEKIKADVNTLRENTDSIEKHLYTLENTRDQYAGIHSEYSEESGGLVSSIKNITESFNRLIKSNDSGFSLEKEIVMSKDTLYTSFHELNELNQGFETYLDLFKNIIVMAKIEIARQSAIQKVEVSIKNIYKEIEKILESVNEIEKVNKTITAVNRSVDRQLVSVLKNSSNYNSVFKNNIYKLVSLCEESTQLIIKIINKLHFISDNYIRTFENIKTRISSIEDILEEILSIRKKTEELFMQNNSEYSLISSEKEKELLGSDRIINLLNKFTIFRHKGKLLEVDTESESVADSSITLF